MNTQIEDLTALRKRHEMGLPWANSDTALLLQIVDTMSQGAARYAWLRQNWGQLVATINWQGSNLPKKMAYIGIAPDLMRVDPQTVDRSIDEAMEREDQSHLVLGQCPKCFAINRHEESCPDHAVNRAGRT